MTEEDIIRMAVEADPGFDGGQNAMELLSNSIVGIAAIERFAALVAAYEREECAKVCETMARRTNDIRRAALEMAVENIMARGQA